MQTLSQQRIDRRNSIEQSLQEQLNYVIEKIKADKITDTNMAQNRYGAEVTRLMRSTAQDAYQLGIDYVTSMRKTVGYLTDADLTIIREQVQTYFIRFWRKVDQIIHRNDVLLQKYNYEPRAELNSNYMATVIAVALVTTTLSMATIQKSRVLKTKSAAIEKKKKCPKGKHWDVKLKKCVNDDVATPSSLPMPSIEDYISPGLALTSFLIGEDDEGYPVTEDVDDTTIVLIWNAILDNRTCSVCEFGNGTEFLPDDPDIPVLGSEGDIHDNCRCMYDIEIRDSF